MSMSEPLTSPGPCHEHLLEALLELDTPNGNDLFRAIIDALPAAVYLTDAQGKIKHFNPACTAFFSGRTPTLGSDHWCVSWKLYHADGRPMRHDECPMAVSLRTGRALRGVEAIAERPDGARIWFQAYPTPLLDSRRRVIGGLNMLVDITERRQAELARARLAAIVESSDDAIISKDLNSIINSWNQGATRIFGYTQEEAIGRPVTMLIPPDRADEEAEILARIRRGEKIDHYETVRRRKDGVLIDVSLTVSPVKDAVGAIVGASKIARDITARKRAEESLREHARALQTLNRVNAALSAELDPQKLVQAVTDAGTELSGARFGAFFFNSIAEDGEAYLLYTLSGAAREAFEKFGVPRKTPLFAPTFTGQGVVRSDDITKDPRYGRMGPHHGMPKGHLPVRSYLAVPVVSRAGQVLGGLSFGHPDAGVFTEQSERLVSGIAAQAAVALDNARLHASLRDSEERFRTMAENIPQLAWMARPDGHIYWYNRRWYEYTGAAPESQEGRGWRSVLHPDHAEAVTDKWARAVHAGQPWEDTFPLRSADGHYRWFLSRAFPIRDEKGNITRWFGTNTDINAQREAEEALRRHQDALQETIRKRTEEITRTHRALAASERMASLGTLAAGLGHDMGNLLMPIRVRLDSLQQQLSSTESAHDVAAIQSGVGYLQKLSNALRLLAVDPDLADGGEPTELRSWWEEARSVLKSSIPGGISLEAVLPDTDCWVAMPRAALTQAVFNLVQNAGEAMRERGSGTIRIGVGLDGQAVRLIVSDDGPGMSAEVRSRCMEPFFTTKSRGVSTGLGLALVHGLVQRAHGSVAVESEPNTGTAITLELSPADPPAAGPPGGTPLACLRVGDARLRAIIASELRSFRYDVRTDPQLMADADLVVSDCCPTNGHGRGRLVLLADPRHAPPAALALGDRPTVEEIRRALRSVRREARE